MTSARSTPALQRSVRPFVVTYQGKSKTVDLAGYYPDDSDEGIHVGDDMAVTDAALQSLKDQYASEENQAANTLTSSAPSTSAASASSTSES
ncbi:hypothetical protein [Rhizobium leguminosarum]|uniref:hypothetical protein n=1 Tax=Rhizobium leguminosarum TaxID=384 RepID=UPI001C9762DA|nr:hypothetical protein [Rhizobium leguminosarum]